MHFVHGVNGLKYGPADLATLQLWVQEGRIAPDTMLEDARTGTLLAAGNLPGLFQAPNQSWHAAPPHSNQPMQTPYVRYDTSLDGSSARSYGQAALVLLIISCIPCCSMGTWWGIAIASVGLGCAITARNQGHEKGQTYTTWGIIMVVLSIGGAIIGEIFSGNLAGAGY